MDLLEEVEEDVRIVPIVLMAVQAAMVLVLLEE
jgi:hypothetical protein